jgi:hypothetical protein
MMMITKMTKISLFVLAGMISGSSAYFNCQQFDNDVESCYFYVDSFICRWDPDHNTCQNVFSPYANLVADVGVDKHFGQDEKGRFHNDDDPFGAYKDEDEDEDEDNDATSDLNLEGEPNVSDKKRSNLRIRTN